MDNMNKFQTNSDIYKVNTRHNHDLNTRMPNANLTRYKSELYYVGINLFSTLPPTIKSLNHDIKVFKPALKD
jgi:hypothetical protein